jgi:hypothetical protein
VLRRDRPERDQGFDAVLYKPVDPAELVALVAHLAPR